MSKYSLTNLAAFSFAGFACVSIIVFLASTQPYFLSQVIDVPAGSIGATIGNLGFFDEIVAIIICPILGVLCDEINTLHWRISGNKLIQSTSFVVLFISLFGFSQWSRSVVPSMYFFRGIFAVGVSGCMSMVPVNLAELVHSDFQIGNQDQEPLSNKKRSGKFSALIGVSTGLGAIFAVSFLLPLPVSLSDSYTIPMRSSLKLSYLIVSGYALVVFAILFATMYNTKRYHTPTHTSAKNYLHTLLEGIKVAKANKQVQLAFVGSFVARSTTVTTSVFIPLLAYNYYSKTGRCGNDDTVNNCHDAYIFSAILTGVAQTIALVSSPLWGYLIDSRFGKTKTILVSSILGVLGNYGLCVAAFREEIYDPRTVVCFATVGFIGLSQIGVIISSMSILSSADVDNSAAAVSQSGDDNAETEAATDADLDSENLITGDNFGPATPSTTTNYAGSRTIGSLSGLYSLSGGVGILLISKLGGSLSDLYITAPFFLLGSFNVVLLLFSLRENQVAI